VVVHGRYVADMSHAAPIEPHAVIAQWEGDHVTIWSSTQVPFPARATVAHTLQMPESSVRVIVPLLGGGFGGKCEPHFEAHVAALARAARRPVKLVFSRREEFIAPDHRREGMTIELETGVTRDGALVSRRGSLVIDNGAYTADAAFFPQLAAMHAVGPYRVENVSVDAQLVYTNNVPSGSVRAPTAPQVCWALEQHLDAIAREIGLDPVELRRRNIVREGDEGPTRQIFNAIGASETLERAVELIGYGKPLPPDEAIGVACGWWPSFTQASGAFVKIEADGSGTIVTGAMECGSGAVMALPILVAEQLGMRPEDFSILSQDTAAGGFDGGASGSQTTFNNGRAVIEAAGEVREQLLDLASDALEVDRGDLELANGAVQVKGSPERNVPISELAATAHGGKLLQGRGSSTPVEAPACEATTCVGRMGMESFLAPTFITHALRCRVDRETGVVRVLEAVAVHDCGLILNPIGAEGQVEGGVVMGIGEALLEGTVLTPEGRQVNAGLLDYKLQTCADAPPITIEFVTAPDASGGGPKGSKGVGEPPCVPTPGAVANAIAKVIGVPVTHLPMTPDRVWSASQGADR
jgi:CO/xanthine dehydrogenase Mo-binding subunit